VHFRSNLINLYRGKLQMISLKECQYIDTRGFTNYIKSIFVMCQVNMQSCDISCRNTEGVTEM
jgi:hypothetical protein